MTTLILLVFIQGQDAATPLAAALVRAAEQALGPGASVIVRPAPDSELSEDAALRAARAEKAFAVAHLSWRSPSGHASHRLEARAVVTVVESGRTTTQTLSFDSADAPVQRGRALGLVLAAMAQPERAARAEEPAPKTPAAAAPAAAPPPAPRAAPPAVAAPAAPTPAPDTVAEAAAATPPVAAATLRWALDAAAEQGFSVGGAGTGIGATIGLRWQPWRRVGFRAGVRGRFGEVEAAQASSRALAASLGASFALVVPADGGREGQGAGHFGLAVRPEALLLNESLSHLSADDPSAVRSGRWLPGAQLLLEAQWALAPAVSLLLDGGPELAFGRTTVFVHDAPVADLGPLRLVIQAGLVARF